MQRHVVDGFIGLLIAVIYLTICMDFKISPISMDFFIGLAIALLGTIAYFIFKRGALAKRISKIVAIAGTISAFAVFAMVFVMLGNM